MATTTRQYSDIFTYETLAFDGANVSYTSVTLLKDLCGKKAGVSVDEIRLDTRTGKFTVPRSKAPALSNASTRATTAMETAAKTLIEFKGKHTRFPDSTEVEDDEPDTRVCAHEDSEDAVWLGNERFVLPPPVRPDPAPTVVTLKLYENKRKLFKPDSTINKYVIDSVIKATNGILVEESTGPRGCLMLNVRTSMELTKNTLTEFTVCTSRSGRGTRKMYYSRVV